MTPIEEQQKIAEACYDYFHVTTSSLHPKIPFKALPPMYIEAWMGVVKVVSTVKDKENIVVAPATSEKAIFICNAEEAKFSRLQIDFLTKYFKFKKDDRLYE